MSSKNKFGFAPVDDAATSPRRRERVPGPMGAAVRDAAESLQETTDAKVQQRRRNAEEAKLYRDAEADGRVLRRLPLGDVYTDALPRDRMELEAVASSDEMEELKTSIRERGQKEPIEVFQGPDGRYQLKKGWRRLTALSQLHAESGEEAFAEVIARVEQGQGSRIGRYVDMVEENVIREDLSFAEMAQVAITAARDEEVDEVDPSTLVNRLYSALHKTKRSYIRSFVYMLSVLGDSLQWPRDIPRNLGVDVARAMKSAERVEALRESLEACRTAEAQNRALAAFVAAEKAVGVGGKAEGLVSPKEKFEFFVGKTKVTARQGECRLVSDRDYAAIHKDRLEKAVRAFEDTLFGPKVR